MIVADWVWAVTIAGFIAVIAVDLLLVDANPHEFGAKEATRWVLFYIGAAIAFGIGLFYVQGPEYAAQFFAGYITEYSLSVDNLFVYVVLMASFAVPVELAHRVLLIGVVVALILRTGLIFVGAGVISSFVGVFYLFGAFLLFTAWKVWTSGDEEPNPDGNALVRFVAGRLPSTTQYVGTKMVVRIDGRRVITPMLLVILAIGSTDLFFALDSIPAVFGLTKETYIVFAVNAFALMGLRQLFFLLHGLIDRLIYLNRGLAIILVFIGIKLVLEAVHGTTNLNIPQPSVAISLTFIIGVLAITALISVRAVKRNPELARAVGDAAAPPTTQPESDDYQA